MSAPSALIKKRYHFAKFQHTIKLCVYVYEYDCHDRLKKITRQGSGPQRVKEYGYDLSGNTAWMTNYDGATTEYGYGGLDQITEISHKFNNAGMMSFQYGYDRDLNIDEITDNKGTHTYAYDNKSQLTETAHSNRRDT